MHCDHWIAWWTFTLLTVCCGAYKPDELNAVILQLNIPLETYQTNAVVKSTFYELLANYSTQDCAQPKVDCKFLVNSAAKPDKEQKKQTAEDIIFSKNGVTEYKPAEAWTSTSNASVTGTTVVVNVRTDRGFHFLKWTDIVRNVYASMDNINSDFSDATNLTATLITANPTSYLAKVINANITTPSIIAGVFLGSALLLFAILVPLSNTKYCRKDPVVAKEDEVIELS